MMKTEKLLIIALILIIIIPVLIYASFISSTMSSNVITFGKLRMELIETSIDENGNEIKVKDNENENISLNSNVSRRVRIKNVCSHPMFVRIKLGLLLDNNYDDTLNNSVWYDINDNDYLYKDGWYYYLKKLEPGKETSNLITQINFNLVGLDNYSSKTIKLNIDAQAVQAENQADNVFSVQGWPE